MADEVREIRAEMARAADRLSRLERRLAGYAET
jgi:hypothetical protein